MKVCHITPVHPSTDVRIFHKECCSLVSMGYEVFLLVSNENSRVEKNVKIIGIDQKFNGRWSRFRKVSRSLYQEALKINADVYHFHDPEFLPFAIKLKKLGKRVIYDVHEDVPRQLLTKFWIPYFFRKMISKLFEVYENWAASKLDAIVGATDLIRDRFKEYNSNSYAVKNFPKLDEWNLTEEMKGIDREELSICYVGSITRVRGIIELVQSLEGTGIKLHLVGNFSPPEMENEVSILKGWENVIYHGLLDRDGVKGIMLRSKIGIVTLHPIINYLDALPVKMFEYMACGLAVLASDIPLWKTIINQSNCGAVVDAKNPNLIRLELLRLFEDKKLLREMGLRGKNAINEYYNWRGESVVLEEVYSKLLNP